jgi:hypothetical protein
MHEDSDKALYHSVNIDVGLSQPILLVMIIVTLETAGTAMDITKKTKSHSSLTSNPPLQETCFHRLTLELLNRQR